jgi:hypothetical protein
MSNIGWWRFGAIEGIIDKVATFLILSRFTHYTMKHTISAYLVPLLTIFCLSTLQAQTLKTKLEKWLKNEVKCEAKSDLPFADITISYNNEYLGVISTDDELYYQSPSIKDVHVYTPFTLSAKHWKYKGIFSRNYWQNEEATKEELRIFVNQVQNS